MWTKTLPQKAMSNVYGGNVWNCTSTKELWRNVAYRSMLESTYRKWEGYCLTFSALELSGKGLCFHFLLQNTVGDLNGFLFLIFSEEHVVYTNVLRRLLIQFCFEFFALKFCGKDEWNFTFIFLFQKSMDYCFTLSISKFCEAYEKNIASKFCGRYEWNFVSSFNYKVCDWNFTSNYVLQSSVDVVNIILLQTIDFKML